MHLSFLFDFFDRFGRYPTAVAVTLRRAGSASAGIRRRAAVIKGVIRRDGLRLASPPEIFRNALRMQPQLPSGIPSALVRRAAARIRDCIRHFFRHGVRILPVPDILLVMRTPPNKKSPYTPLSVWRKMSLISQKNPYRFWNFIILRTAGDVNRIVKIFRGRGKDACSGIRTADRELRGMLSRYRRAARVGGCELHCLPHVRRGL